MPDGQRNRRGKNHASRWLEEDKRENKETGKMQHIFLVGVSEIIGTTKKNLVI